MKYFFNFSNLYVFFLLISISGISENQVFAESKMKLWYNTEASRWEEALPLGNGRLGAMVFGTVETEHIQLNEETVWAGEPGNNLPSGFYEILGDARTLILSGKYKLAEDLIMSRVPRHAPENNNYGMPYQPVGDIFINFPGHKNVKNYYRELDIQNAISIVTYSVDGVEYQRETFISFTDDVIIVRLTANKKGAIKCALGLSSPHIKNQIHVQGNLLRLKGNSGDVENKKGKIKFETLLQPILEGGELITDDSILTVKNANALTIYISIGTNFKNYQNISGDETARAEEILAGAIKKKYETAKRDHIQKYRSFFDRVTLDLGVTAAVNHPTDQRISEFANGNDPQLVELYFQFGRYLLISSSQSGGQPANLQGIWNDKLNPPWDSKYTININTEMNYWPAEVTNLSEMHEPLFSMIKNLSQSGKEAATKMYHARGWVVHHNTDLWRIAGPVDGAFYGMWPMGGAWLSQHIWQHYLYSGNMEFLNEYYPVLKNLAGFYADVLQEEPTNGWLVVCPSMSPENRHPKGTSIAAGNTMDNQLVFDVFSNSIHAARILGLDAEFTDTLMKKLDRLPPMQIGQYGQLQEWLKDWDNPEDHHRHVSHLYGLYPSNQISPYRTPELFQAAKQVLINRGDVSTGWSMGWKVNLWARLLDGNHAWKLIKDQLTPAGLEERGQKGGTYPNLFDAHPPFQIDGNFGCTAGVAEMLLQSHDGTIHILPALPDAWQSGKVSGLRARGGFTVSIDWQKGHLKKIIIKSNIGGNCRIRVPEKIKTEKDGNFRIAEGENPNSFYSLPDIKSPIIKKNPGIPKLKKTFIYDFESEAGEEYAFYSLAEELTHKK